MKLILIFFGFIPLLLTIKLLKEPSQAPLKINHDLDFEEPCKIKQGFLIYMPNNKTKTSVFVIMNENSVSIFEKENELNSVINSIPLADLRNLRKKSSLCIVLPSYSSSSSFTSSSLSSNSSSSSTSFPSSSSYPLLCSDSRKSLSFWLASLKSFQNCKEGEGRRREEGGKGGGKKKEEGGGWSRKQEEGKRSEEEGRREDDNSVYNEGFKLGLEKELEGLKREILRDKLTESKEKKRLENERKKVAGITRRLEEEQSCLARALQTKASEEGRIAEGLIKQVMNCIISFCI